MRWKMNHRDLINLIYGIQPGQRVIYCSHCGRPMSLAKDSNGKTVLVCRHCIELKEEEA